MRSIIVSVVLFIVLCNDGCEMLKINGGSEVLIKDAGYMALIRVNVNASLNYKCGGSIISDKHILTAGHCVTTSHRNDPNPVHLIDPEYFTILVGTADMTNFNRKGIVTYVEKVIFRENSKKNDIAILKLNASIPFTRSTRRPVTLPAKSDYIPENGTKVYVDGWGHTTIPTYNLLRAHVETYIGPLCDNIGVDPKFDICTYDEHGAGPCDGDHGGPLLLHHDDEDDDDVQIGIVTSVPIECTNELLDPSIYTSVAANLDWIKSVISGEEDTLPFTRTNPSNDVTVPVVMM
ncbi:Trypsin 3A1 [Pseudolycoriella hygida]|uniref:Trypsin 3A1 n=1 Tax=Pseudolycoriella hygida TaxID=35572 RepID=A0A9Q0N293_9DIPT|nr:Trypsin 3A1 [Pseudolycoriella hygida]